MMIDIDVCQTIGLLGVVGVHGDFSEFGGVGGGVGATTAQGGDIRGDAAADDYNDNDEV